MSKPSRNYSITAGKNLTEADIIKSLRKLERPHPKVIKGIGDDCAVLKSLSKDEVLLCTTDLLIEKIDFDFEYTDPYAIGIKALAVNLSDIAAMGGTPLYYTVALGLPKERTNDFVKPFYEGLRVLERKFKVTLVGGDLSRSRQEVFISLMVLGKAKWDKVVYRSGAEVGDLIFVTGTLGGSATGLRLFQQGHRIKSAEGALAKGMIGAALLTHLYPTPQVETGRWLAENGMASAMIDISDGLSTDLHHLCEESHVGAKICADAVPISDPTRSLEKDPLAVALHGGEDFELLFTVPQAKANRLLKRYPFHQPPLTQIGHVVNRKGGVKIIYSGGRLKRLRPQGYDHFKA